MLATNTDCPSCLARTLQTRPSTWCAIGFLGGLFLGLVGGFTCLVH